MIEQAIRKLNSEYADGKYDRYAGVMKKSVLEALETFCRQNEEFAQAVVQGGTFENCMKAVAKNCGSSLSDPEAYTRAVQFYFPTAEVRVQISIDLTPHDTEDDAKTATEGTQRAVVLNLADFLM